MDLDANVPPTLHLHGHDIEGSTIARGSLAGASGGRHADIRAVTWDPGNVMDGLIRHVRTLPLCPRASIVVATVISAGSATCVRRHVLK